MKGEDIIKKELPYQIQRELTVNTDGKQLFVRIPKEIEQFLKIKKGDKIEFFIDPQEKKEDYHKFRVNKGKK